VVLLEQNCLCQCEAFCFSQVEKCRHLEAHVETRILMSRIWRFCQQYKISQPRVARSLVGRHARAAPVLGASLNWERRST